MAQQNRKFENSEQLYKSTSAKNTQVKTAVEWLLSELSFINSLDDVIDGSAKAILTTAVIKQAKQWKSLK